MLHRYDICSWSVFIVCPTFSLLRRNLAYFDLLFKVSTLNNRFNDKVRTINTIPVELSFRDISGTIYHKVKAINVLISMSNLLDITVHYLKKTIAHVLQHKK